MFEHYVCVFVLVQVPAVSSIQPWQIQNFEMLYLFRWKYTHSTKKKKQIANENKNVERADVTAGVTKQIKKKNTSKTDEEEESEEEEEKEEEQKQEEKTIANISTLCS